MYETEEMYLKTILKLSSEKGTVQAVDIAAERGFAKSTVSVALKSLSRKGMVAIDCRGGVALTEQGLILAKKLSRKNHVLKECFQALGVVEKDADADACKIEHCISDTTFEAVEKFYLERRKGNAES